MGGVAYASTVTLVQGPSRMLVARRSPYIRDDYLGGYVLGTHSSHCGDGHRHIGWLGMCVQLGQTCRADKRISVHPSSELWL